jgi:tetratricopeptide (TPR) repeat protein
LELALRMAKEMRSPTWIHIVGGGLGEAHLRNGDLAAAEVCLASALALPAPMDTLGRRYAWALRAELVLHQGEPARAVEICDRLVAAARSPGESERVITYLWLLKGLALVDLKRPHEALPLLQEAVDHVARSGERYLLWRLYAALGDAHRTTGSPDLAAASFARAETEIETLAATLPDEDLREAFRHAAGKSINLMTD